MKYAIEVTDTFSGEANYCWVKRETIEVPEYGARRIAFRRRVIREVRRVAGWPVGVRVETEDYGDGFTIRPRGLCQVAFANYAED